MFLKFRHFYELGAPSALLFNLHNYSCVLDLFQSCTRHASKKTKGWGQCTRDVRPYAFREEDRTGPSVLSRALAMCATLQGP